MARMTSKSKRKTRQPAPRRSPPVGDLGPVFAAARHEPNWLVYKLIPREGKKPAKVPWDIDLNRADGSGAVARYTFDEADGHAERLGEDFGIGYLAREGSAMVALDLDGALVDGQLAGWAEGWPLDETYVEVSPSGTGLRVLLPREGWPFLSKEATGVPGIIASDQRFFTVSLVTPFGPDRPIAPAPRLLAAMQPHLDGWMAPPEDDAAAANVGWFDGLDHEAQIACAAAILDALPPEWRNERDLWRDATFALRAYPHTIDVWDAWSRGGIGYDGAENRVLWDERERGKHRITMGSLIHHATTAGLDLGPWRQQGSAQAQSAKLNLLAERVMARPGGLRLVVEAEVRAEMKAEAEAEEEEPDEPPTLDWEPIGPDWLRVKPDPLPMIVEGLMPQAPMLIAGTGGTRKTTVVLKLMIHIALGLDLWGYKVTRPGRVVLLTAEDSEEQCRYRLYHVAKAMGLTEEQIDAASANMLIIDVTDLDPRLLHPNKDQDLIRSDFATWLLANVERWQPSAIFLDPTSNFGPGERFVNDGPSALMQFGQALSRAGRCATVFLHHVAKAVARGGTDDQHAGRGGSAFADNARAVWLFTVPTSRPDDLPPEVHDAAWQEGNLVSINIAKQSYAARPREHQFVVVEDGAFDLKMVGGTPPAKGGNSDDRDDAAVYRYIREHARTKNLTENAMRTATVSWEMPDGQASTPIGKARIERALQRLLLSEAIRAEDVVPRPARGARTRIVPTDPLWHEQ